MNKDYPMAVISDIHSNVYALETVLRDIDSRGIKTIVNLGDTMFGPIAPIQTAELLLKRSDMIHIMGNCDRYLLADHMESEIFNYVKPLLTEQLHSWIRSFKRTWVFEDMLYCHGTPFKDDAYLLEGVTQYGVNEKSVEVLVQELANVSQKMIFCGHTHLHKTVWLPDGKVIVNPGSVGLPAYFEEEPLPHSMESMTPHTKYAIVRHKESSWAIEHILLTYDWELAAQTAEQNGRNDYAYALRHGRVKVE